MKLSSHADRTEKLPGIRAEDLHKWIDEFYGHFARNCLGDKAPLGLFGRIKTQGGRKAIHLKECLKPLETFARLYAVKHSIAEPGTSGRLNALLAADVLQEDTQRDMIFVLETLSQMRFFNQITESADLRANTDELDLDSLSGVERNNLQNVLARIPVFQNKLSYDFFGRQL